MAIPSGDDDVQLVRPLPLDQFWVPTDITVDVGTIDSPWAAIFGGDYVTTDGQVEWQTDYLLPGNANGPDLTPDMEWEVALGLPRRVGRLVLARRQNKLTRVLRGELAHLLAWYPHLFEEPNLSRCIAAANA